MELIKLIGFRYMVYGAYSLKDSVIWCMELKAYRIPLYGVWSLKLIGFRNMVYGAYSL